MKKMFEELVKLTDSPNISIAIDKLTKEEFIDGLNKEKTKKILKWTKNLINISMFDSTTSLLLKEHFISLLKDKQSKSDYLIFADLDNFKTLNDEYGHLVGDQILMHIAKILKKSFRRNNQSPFRSSDLVGRYGGDEFIIYMSNCSEEVVKRRIDYLYQILSIPYQVDEKNSVIVDLSLNYIKYENDLTFEENFKKVDDLVYQEKIIKKMS